MAGNVISDTPRVAVDNYWAVRCTNIVLEWKLRASLATAQAQTYTVIWHNADPTTMNDRNYVYQYLYLFWDDFARNSLASSYTLPTYTTTVANYSVQVMSSLDYVGAAHQVLDGTLLDLDVSADFLRDTVAVGDYAVGVIILRGGYAMGGVIVRCEVDVVNIILHYVTVGTMILRGEVAEGGIMVRYDVTIGGVTVGGCTEAYMILCGGCAVWGGGRRDCGQRRDRGLRRGCGILDNQPGCYPLRGGMV